MVNVIWAYRVKNNCMFIYSKVKDRKKTSFFTICSQSVRQFDLQV